MNAERSRIVESGLRLAQQRNPALPLFRHSLARNEVADPAYLRRYAERRLRWLVRFAAARSRAHRQAFSDAGVDPKRIRSLEDLTLLPTMRRGDLVEDPDRFLTLPRTLMRAAHTSGTSGEPATCYRTPGSIVFEVAALERQLRWHGLSGGLRSAILREDYPTTRPDELCRARGPRHIQVSPRALAPRRLPDLMTALERFRPEMVEGWPSRLAEFALALESAGRTLPVAAVRTSSEPVLTDQRPLFQRVFGGAQIDLYGQTERVAMGGTCEQGGFHLFTDYGVVELVPAQGAEGRHELVGTPLHNWGFPLLRYRTGDFATVDDEGTCSCGRPFPVISAIEGRLESLVDSRDGRKIPLASAVLDDLVGIREAQLIQHRPGDFEICVVPGRTFVLEEAERQIRANVDRVIGPGQTVAVTVRPALERSKSGKRSPVIVRG
jgi:phenylacetate-CoA ligase